MEYSKIPRVGGTNFPAEFWVLVGLREEVSSVLYSVCTLDTGCMTDYNLLIFIIILPILFLLH